MKTKKQLEKGCGKRLPTKQLQVRDSLVCNEYQLCKSCKKKTSTCICGHNKHFHDHGFAKEKLGNCDYDSPMDKTSCKCKKFQEVGG